MVALRSAAWGLLLAAVVPAQRTWVVDAAGGGNFTDLPPALAVATHGDTILVRAGVYLPGRTSQGIRIVGDPGAQLDHGTFTVSHVPAGQEFRMTGLRLLPVVYPWADGGAIVVSQCTGAVLLQDLTINSGYSLDGWQMPGLTFSGCADVQVHHCAVSGFTGADVTDSRVTFTQSAIASFYDNPGLRAVDSVVDCADTVLDGGDEVPVSTGTMAWPAAVVDHGVLRMCMGDLIPGNWHAFISTWPAEHIRATDGSILVIDPGVAGPLQITGSGSTLLRPHLACLRATAPMAGQPVMSTLDAPAGLPAVVAASLPAVGVPTPFGDLNLDPVTIVPLAFGTTPLTVPPLTLSPAFVPGDAVTVQALVGFPRGLELSDAVDVMVF